MITILFLFLFLAACRHVHAQDALTALNNVPPPPTSVVPYAPPPLKNAALWQQAVAIDIAKNLTGNLTNKYFYSQLAWWQSLENSSNSYQSGGPSSLDAGPYVSQFLETIEIYPGRFDQAQASYPERTPSKSGPAEIQKSMI